MVYPLKLAVVSLILPLTMCGAKDIEPTVDGNIIKRTDERFAGKEKKIRREVMKALGLKK